MTPPALRWDRGTLLLEGLPEEAWPASARFDARVGLPRAPAAAYHEVVLHLHGEGVAFRDEARAYVALEREHEGDRVPRPYQAEAVDAWWRRGRRGVVVLPTGAGKSFVAELCIARAARSALVVAPTLDLVGQWYDALRRAFGEPVGLLGGGHHELEAITVATYDSAWMQVERWGDRFGLLVFDEVHHLPGPSYAQAATGSIAPFRLGLTATLERPDGAHAWLDELVGPVVFRREITDLAGDFLAPYRTEVLTVHLDAADRAAYAQAEDQWRGFVAARGIRLGGRGGWAHFLRETARSKEGREAFRAWRRARELVQAAPEKLRRLAEILAHHRDGRVIVFTHDNATVHAISRALLVPAITHQTDVKERRALLEAFASGELPVIVTSRVLNEGVDVPAADVAVVLSGTATVREHVQRLGRILRPREGKQAVLYELVVAESHEARTSARRRDHAAYRES
ncbi:MAG: DEAD/DEAH box helicase [Alphaproteobacteria bacterium]|nr:DEAD/DEAH box helicase [Alphaproteobacteria bacterium]